MSDVAPYWENFSYDPHVPCLNDSVVNCSVIHSYLLLPPLNEEYTSASFVTSLTVFPVGHVTCFGHQHKSEQAVDCIQAGAVQRGCSLIPMSTMEDMWSKFIVDLEQSLSWLVALCSMSKKQMFYHCFCCDSLGNVFVCQCSTS